MKKYILFDFDGVIANSWAPAFETNKLMCPDITEDDYRKAFYGNIKDWDTSKIIHTEKCQHNIDFFGVFIPKLMTQATMFSGMKEVLEELARTYTLIIVSSTISAPISDLLKKFNLTSYFTEVMGYDVQSSKVEKIKMVFNKYKTTSENCVFITDTVGDIHEAKKTGISSICVCWGFHDKETLLKENPFAIVNSPAELSDAISKYFS